MSRIRLHHNLRGTALRAAVAGLLGVALVARAQESKSAPPSRPLFPENEVGRLLPKDDTKKSGTGKIERLAPESPMNGVADLPLFMTPSPQPQRRGPITREQLEEIDKRKNWIFQDAKSADKNADKMLGVREERSAEEEQKEYKDLMQQHLEKGMSKSDLKRKNGSDSDAKDSDDSRSRAENQAAGADSFFILPGDGARFGNKTDGQEARPFGAKPATTATGFFSTPPSGGVAVGGFNPPSGVGRSSFLPETSGGAARTDSQREWAAEFKQMLDGRAPSSGFGRGSDPAGLLADPSKQSLNPVIGMRPDPYARPATSLPSTPGFSLPARPTAFDNFNRTPSLSGNNPSLFGSPAISSPGFGSQVPSPSALPRTGGFQELPKRKF